MPPLLTPPRLALLREILAQPTAPFREMHVTRCVEAHLERARVPFFHDPAGNIVLGVDSATAYRRRLRERADEPLRLFIAHMDHPGFHGTRWLDERHLAIRWLGGSPVKHMHRAQVWLGDEHGRLGEGRLAEVRRHPQGWAIETAVLRLEQPLVPRPAAGTLFGGLAFRAPCWTRGRRLYAHAADDLAGVFAIVSTAIDQYRRRRAETSPFLALLTRGEEVGFVGAVRHLELGWLAARRRTVVAVSLEASRNLPGARLGKGPVVRLGDRRTVFDADGLQVLSNLAERLLPGRHQRRIMDGGSCEATATTAWGLPTIGLTLPLGNYHNQGLDGGMDCPRADGPAPEFVHLDDIDGLLRLCRGLLRRGLPWKDPWGGLRGRLARNSRRYPGHN